MAVPKSLLDGVEAGVCTAIGISALRHRSALLSLKDVSDVGIVSIVHAAIAANYAQAGSTANKDRSAANWRWGEIQHQISAANRSPEVVLERAIAAACHRLGRADWSNQIPVASGLVGASDNRRAIDLVHRRGESHFEIVELKIGSDTPLFAAIEIIGYAMLWLLARNDRPARASALLDASAVDLRVLAPAQYYSRFALKPLEQTLDAEVAALGRDHGVAFSFRFDVLPPALLSAPLPVDVALLAALAARTPLHGGTGR